MKIIIITITIIMPQLPKGSDIKHVCLSVHLSIAYLTLSR